MLDDSGTEFPPIMSDRSDTRLNGRILRRFAPQNDKRDLGMTKEDFGPDKALPCHSERSEESVLEQPTPFRVGRQNT